jgi:hypothetical protein
MDALDFALAYAAGIVAGGFVFWLGYFVGRGS